MAGKGKPAAAVAFGLVVDLAERLVAVGMSPDQIPELDQAIALVWPRTPRAGRLLPGRRPRLDAGE